MMYVKVFRRLLITSILSICRMYCYFTVFTLFLLCLLYRQPVVANVSLKGLSADIAQRPSAKAIRYSEKHILFTFPSFVSLKLEDCI